MPFLDIYMPDEVPGYPCVSVPLTNTSIGEEASGSEHRNQNWEHPRHRFIMPEAIARDWEVVQSLGKMWKITAGPYRSFAWRDPLDFSSGDLAVPNPATDPVPTMTDQFIGFGTGFTDAFQLVKTYTYSGETYERTIHLPVLSSVVVAIDGVLVPDTDYSVSRPGGIITFDTPPDDDVSITAGFLFDVEVRFESDDVLESILRTWQAGGFSDLTLIEVRPC